MTTRRDLLASAAALSAAAAPALSSPAWAQAPQSRPQPATMTAYLDLLAKEMLDRSPERVTGLGLDKGDRARQKSLWSDASIAHREDNKAWRAQKLAQLRAVPKASFTGSDAINAAIFDDIYSRAVAADRAFGWGDGPGSPYRIDQQGCFAVTASEFLDSAHTIETADDCHAYLARLNGFATVTDQDIEAARHDGGIGVIPPDFVLDKTLTELKTLRDTPIETADLIQSLVRRAKEKNIPGDWETPARAIYRQTVLPSIDRLAAHLGEQRKMAVHDAGVGHLPDGPAFYAASLQEQTTTTLSPKEVHRIGLDLVAQLSSQMDVVFRSQGVTQGTSGQRLHALFADPRFIAPNTDAGKAKLIADANTRIQKVQAKLPAYFGVLPKAPVEVRRIAAASELSASTHYQSASLDGARPGVYWLNLRDTAETPTWDLWTTTYHEAIPGHHMQISIQQEATLPLARKMTGFNAYVEGWALYAEQLAADEMGMYADDPFGRLGYLHDAQLRAVRLVVDTGLHDQKWTREQAVRYFADNLGDPEGAVVSEVERYCVSPGQACGYMVGKITWLRAREKARQRLGARFDIRRFHDAGLTAGSMPLSVLERVLDTYV